MDGRVRGSTRGPRVPKNFHPLQKSREKSKKKFRVPFFFMASGLQWHCFTAKGVYGLWLSSGHGSWLPQSLCMEFAVTALQVYLQLSALISTYLLFPAEDCFFPPLCACPCMEWRFRGSYNRQASNPNALNFALQCNAFKRITLSSSVSHLCVLFRLQCILYFELHFEKCQTAVVLSLFGGVSINSYFTCYLDEVWYE